MNKQTKKITEQQLIELERTIALQDINYFRKRVCDFHDFQEFHKQIDEILTSSSKSSIIIIPRNHLKSSAIMSWILHSLLKLPDLSVLYESSVYTQAIKYVNFMKNLMDDSKWTSLFGSYRGDKWTDSQLTINKRTIFQPAPTISASGVDKTQTGQHYDIIVGDDIVDEHNSRTEDGRQKVINRYKQYLSLLRPNGRLLLIGTPWDEKDLYGWLQNQPDIIGQFRVLRFGAYKADGSILFPSKFCETIEEESRIENRGKRSFESLRIQYGPYLFNCNYMCVPYRGSESEFNETWIKHSSVDECNRRLKEVPGKVYIFCDPAMGKEHTQNPCDVGLIVAHFMPSHRVDVLEDHTKRMTPGDTVDWLEVLAMKYARDNEVEVVIEDIGFQGVLITMLTDRMHKNGIYYQITPFNPRGDKDGRIRALFTYYQFNQITHSEKIKDGKLENQLKRFPLDRLRDAADAFAQFPQVLNWPMRKMVKEPDWMQDIPVSRYSKRAYPNKKPEQKTESVSYLLKNNDSMFNIG